MLGAFNYQIDDVVHPFSERKTKYELEGLIYQELGVSLEQESDMPVFVKVTKLEK